ncbi:ER membrane protein complex subunit 7 [Thelohanellus kitauei]|uniref:ER membrane protein complex subunit 7 n=1 Tax=Thelohanellus kitauei TaxID=669202 RepID=A0A0C2MA14_THEKT|nr:ER membrane protein complex subunit 7 [Thelohanellus kitauei]
MKDTVCLFLAYIIIGRIDGKSSKFSIKGKVIIDDDVDMNWIHKTRVILGNGLQSTYLHPNGSFSFEYINSGNYMLSVISPNHFFQSLYVKVDADGSLSAKTINQPNFIFQNEFIFTSKLRANYEIQKSDYNILGFLKNPIFMLLVFSFVLVKVQGILSSYLTDETPDPATTSSQVRESIKSTLDRVFKPKET